MHTRGHASEVTENGPRASVGAALGGGAALGRTGRKKIFDRPQQGFGIARVDVAVGFLYAPYAGTCEAEYESAWIGITIAADDLHLVLGGDRDAEKHKVEWASARFHRGIETEYGLGIVASTPEQVVAGVQEGGIVGDGEDAGHGSTRCRAAGAGCRAG